MLPGFHGFDLTYVHIYRHSISKGIEVYDMRVA